MRGRGEKGREGGREEGRKGGREGERGEGRELCCGAQDPTKKRDILMR